MFTPSEKRQLDMYRKLISAAIYGDCTYFEKLDVPSVRQIDADSITDSGYVSAASAEKLVKLLFSGQFKAL